MDSSNSKKRKYFMTGIVTGVLFVMILIGGFFGGSYTVFAGGGGAVGKCAVTHYSCIKGASTSNVNGASAWTWSCTSAYGSATSCSETKPPPVAHINVTSTSINQGGSATISWSSSYAISCSGTNFNTGNRTSGSVQVSPKVSTRYSIKCSQ